MRFAVTVTFILAALAAQSQTPNRSGEAKLRQLFEDYKKLHSFEAVVSKSSRFNRHGVLEASQSLTLSYSNRKKFRVVGTGMWGDAVLYVSDGKNLFYDTLNDSDPRAALRHTQEAIYLNGADLKTSGGFSSLLFYFLNGKDGYDSLVSSSGDIMYTGNRLTFQSKDLGIVVLFLTRSETGDLVERIEYDNLPKREAEYRLFPAWSEKPDGPLEVEEITYNFRPRFGRDTFSTKPPKGLRVTDQRKKGA